MRATEKQSKYQSFLYLVFDNRLIRSIKSTVQIYSVLFHLLHRHQIVDIISGGLTGTGTLNVTW